MKLAVEMAVMEIDGHVRLVGLDIRHVEALRADAALVAQESALEVHAALRVLALRAESLAVDEAGALDRAALVPQTFKGETWRVKDLSEIDVGKEFS